MGGNENHHHHHQFYHHKSTFLPILCSRPSIKDVTLPRCTRGNPASSCNDPLSPRIGCMGQVKRNNKIAGFPTSQYRLSFTTKSSTPISPVVKVKYSKLKRLFSGKNLSTTPSATAATTISSSYGTKQRVAANSTAGVPKNQRCRNENLVAINIDEMDPPLPVIKRVPKLEEGGDSLWKRRSGGPPLKSLQLQQIHHHPKICLQPTTV